MKELSKSAKYKSSELTRFLACADNANLDSLSPGKVKDQKVKQIYSHAIRVLADIICTKSEENENYNTKFLFIMLLGIHSDLSGQEDVEQKQLFLEGLLTEPITS